MAKTGLQSILSLRHGEKAMSGSIKTEINKWISKVKWKAKTVDEQINILGYLRLLLGGGDYFQLCYLQYTQKPSERLCGTLLIP